MPSNWLLRGLIIALVFGVPAGAIGALTLQRTLRSGFRAGLLTGLGSTAADTIYAAIGMFGVAAVSDVLLRWQRPICTAGGLFILLLGLLTLRKKAADSTEAEDVSLPGCFASSFAVAMANPATILSFFAALAVMGIDETPQARDAAQLVLGITLGTALWWLTLSGAASLLRRKVTPRGMGLLNRILGILLMAFGLYTAIRTWL